MEKETIFYKKFSPKYIAIKVTNEYIEIYKSYNNPIKILFKDIQKIAFRNRYNIQFVIYTKNKKVISIDALTIDNLERLIELLTTKHPLLIDHNLQYDLYKNAVESTNYTFFYIAFLFVVLFVLFIGFIITK